MMQLNLHFIDLERPMRAFILPSSTGLSALFLILLALALEGCTNNTLLLVTLNRFLISTVGRTFTFSYFCIEY